MIYTATVNYIRLIFFVLLEAHFFAGAAESCPDIENRQNELIAIDKTRTKKADKNFWIRSIKLLNIIIKNANIEIKEIDEQYLAKVYWNYFENCYSEGNSCSWTLLCNCGSCSTIQKVVNSTPQ